MSDEDSSFLFLLRFHAKCSFLLYCLSNLLSFESKCQTRQRWLNTNDHKRLLYFQYLLLEKEIDGLFLDLHKILSTKHCLISYLFEFCLRLDYVHWAVINGNMGIFDAIKCVDDNVLALNVMPSTRVHQITFLFYWSILSHNSTSTSIDMISLQKK